METILSFSGIAVAQAHHSGIFFTDTPQVDCGIEAVERIGVSIDQTEWTPRLENETFRIGDGDLTEELLGLDRDLGYEGATTTAFFDDNKTFSVGDLAEGPLGIDRDLLQSGAKTGILDTDDGAIRLSDLTESPPGVDCDLLYGGPTRVHEDNETLRVDDLPEGPLGVSCCNVLSKGITRNSIADEDEISCLDNLTEGSPSVNSGWLYVNSTKGFLTADDDNFHVGDFAEDGVGVGSNLPTEDLTVESLTCDDGVTRFNDPTEGSPDIGSDLFFGEDRTDLFGTEDAGFRLSNLPGESPDLGSDLLCDDAPADSFCADNGAVYFGNLTDGPLGLDRDFLNGGITATSLATDDRTFRLGDLKKDLLGVDRDVLREGVATDSLIDNEKTFRFSDLTTESPGIDRSLLHGETRDLLAKDEGTFRVGDLWEESIGHARSLVFEEESMAAALLDDNELWSNDLVGGPLGVDRDLIYGSAPSGFPGDYNYNGVGSFKAALPIDEFNLFNLDEQAVALAGSSVDPVNSLFDKEAATESIGLHGSLTQAGPLAQGFVGANTTRPLSNNSSARSTVGTRSSSASADEVASAAARLQQLMECLSEDIRAWWSQKERLGKVITILSLPTIMFSYMQLVNRINSRMYSTRSSNTQAEKRVDKPAQPRPPYKGNTTEDTVAAPIPAIRSQSSPSELLRPRTSTTTSHSDSGDKSK